MLFLDCDGVLANFDGHYFHNYGCTSEDYETAHGSKKFWMDLKYKTPTFFRDLPVMHDAYELYDAVKHLKPTILTGCPFGGWAEPQKRAWAAEHFPGVPVITCRSRDKRKYMIAGEENVIVDDYVKYMHLWEEVGGIFILHKNTVDSLVKLRELGII